MAFGSREGRSTDLTPEQIARRGAIMAALWARQSESEVMTDGQVAAASAVAAELEEVIAEAAGSRAFGEIGRTWKYVGDACYSGAGRSDGDLLRRAIRAYRRALEMLAAGADELLIAKTEVNLANCLICLGGASRRAHLAEARRLYRKALEVLRVRLPSEVAYVRRSLANALALEEAEHGVPPTPLASDVVSPGTER